MESASDVESDFRWRQYLQARYYDVSLCALTVETKSLLAEYLDLPIRSIEGDFIADYSGLAGNVGLNIALVEHLRTSECGHTRGVIDEWISCYIPRVKPTLGNLVRALIMLNREDVLTDCMNAISGDAREFLNVNGEKLNVAVQRQVISSSEILTTDDMVHRMIYYYDVFAIINEDKLNNCFEMEIVKRLKKKPYNLRIYHSEISGLYGVNKYETDARVMGERCQHVIIFFSPDCLNSEMFCFLSSIAVSLSARDQSRRVIPILIQDYQQADLPNYLQIKKVWDFSKQQDESMWQQMALSLCHIN